MLRGVASALHERHEAEMPESEVVRHLAAMLPQMGQPQEDALRIVREIRDRSGVLVERRPGAFAFSHLTFQEYLTALDYAPRSPELLAHLDDPWWHEVIALACGISGCDAAAIIQAYLSRNTPQDVIMAAKCLETAVSVRLDLRDEVERALERVLPSSTWALGPQLLECGLTVAPILARHFTRYDACGQDQALGFFESFLYEPVIPVLVERTSSQEKSRSLITGNYTLTVGERSIVALCFMARTSERAGAAVTSVLSRTPQSEAFLKWLELCGLLGDEFKPSRQGKRGSKHAKSTV